MHRARWRQQRCPVPWVCDRTHTHQHNQTTPRSRSPPRVPGGVPTPARSRGTGARAAITSQHTTCGDGDQWGAGGRDRARGRGGVHSENPQTHKLENRQPWRGAPPTPAPLPKAAKGPAAHVTPRTRYQCCVGVEVTCAWERGRVQGRHRHKGGGRGTQLPGATPPRFAWAHHRPAPHAPTPTVTAAPQRRTL